ncbi:MAG: hypothetical protein WCK51_11455 [Armatimonadota bacterium]
MGALLAAVCVNVFAAHPAAGTLKQVERGEWLRLARLSCSEDYEVSSRAGEQLRKLIIRLPNQQRLELINDPDQEIRIQAIQVSAKYFRTHVDEWCRTVENSRTNLDKYKLMDTFEACRLNDRDLISYLTVCHGFRNTDDRGLRIAVIESMGRAKVKTKAQRDLVVSVLGIFATNGGHKDDRARAFSASHNLNETNPF